MTYTIEKNGTKLNTRIKATLKQYMTAGERIHRDAIDAIWHACQNGNVTPMNTLFEGLRSNDKQAFRLFLRRIQVINGLVIDGKPVKTATPDGMTAEAVQAAALSGAVFGFEKGRVTVVNGHTSPQAKQLADLCEARFMNPDGKIDQKVLDRNNFAEVKTLGDKEALEAVSRLLKSMSKDTETKKHELTNPVKNMFDSFLEKIEFTSKQLTLNEG